MKFSKRTKFLFLCLLVLLNVIIRIPSFPHESGCDSFMIHILANSVSENGYAKWWINPLSIFGLYPYSECSAVPFALSGINQCTGLEMEFVLWLFSVIMGLFSAFAAYILAGRIKDNDVFIFLVAFSYSLAPGILAFTTWNLSMRGPFMALLPLFIYVLLKSRIFLFRCCILTLIIFILLGSIHHLIYFTLPIILSFVVVSLLYNKIKITTNSVNIAFVIGFIGMFALPFFTGMLIEHSRYNQLHEMLENNVRYTGFLLLFTLGGFVYLSLKSEKSFGEWLLLAFLLCFAPLMWIRIYAFWFTTLFSCLLIGASLTNATNIIKINEKRKIASVILIISLLLAVSFSGFYQHWRTHIGKATAGEWYMDEEMYAGALWIRDNIDKNKRMVGNDDLGAKRMSAISEVPTLVDAADTVMFVYGFADINNTPIVKNSPLSTSFYMDNPYVISRNFTRVGYFRNSLQHIDVDRGKSIISRFNLSYAIENQNIGKNEFIQSLYMKKNSIYDNGKFRVWSLE
ncbi:hypothetical protein CW713_04200 [Methanophagales archaeon]|nr:MAG: hypothetical protein CW713_04200 [Methanophagales archaeon]